MTGHGWVARYVSVLFLTHYLVQTLCIVPGVGAEPILAQDFVLIAEEEDGRDVIQILELREEGESYLQLLFGQTAAHQSTIISEGVDVIHDVVLQRGSKVPDFADDMFYTVKLAGEQDAWQLRRSPFGYGSEDHVEVLLSSPSMMAGLAIDPITNKLFLAMPEQGSVLSLDLPNLATVQVAIGPSTGIHRPWSLKADTLQRYLLVGSHSHLDAADPTPGVSRGGAIYRFDLDNLATPPLLIKSDGAYPHSIDLHQDGTHVIYGGYDNEVMSVAIDGSGLPYPAYRIDPIIERVFSTSVQPDGGMFIVQGCWSGSEKNAPRILYGSSNGTDSLLTLNTKNLRCPRILRPVESLEGVRAPLISPLVLGLAVGAAAAFTLLCLGAVVVSRSRRRANALDDAEPGRSGRSAASGSAGSAGKQAGKATGSKGSRKATAGKAGAGSKGSRRKQGSKGSRRKDTGKGAGKGAGKGGSKGSRRRDGGSKGHRGGADESMLLKERSRHAAAIVPAHGVVKDLAAPMTLGSQYSQESDNDFTRRRGESEDVMPAARMTGAARETRQQNRSPTRQRKTKHSNARSDERQVGRMTGQRVETYVDVAIDDEAYMSTEAAAGDIDVDRASPDLDAQYDGDTVLILDHHYDSGLTEMSAMTLAPPPPYRERERDTDDGDAK